MFLCTIIEEEEVKPMTLEIHRYFKNWYPHKFGYQKEVQFAQMGISISSAKIIDNKKTLMENNGTTYLQN